eukprot:CAMPEP_0197605710 /NCGR_PEP_ID=MMETSP1326-20131121/43658_1 /TAXON_ID=1155430 /ORGANISM="Genus nov. species nov., Strain RCC2288" /LENGTH=62 /DNA_ID=CAMNT_0043173541 /DNA_START=48 /DNA_END=232 /DNA_ORIENTATION=+
MAGAAEGAEKSVEWATNNTFGSVGGDGAPSGRFFSSNKAACADSAAAHAAATAAKKSAKQSL